MKLSQILKRIFALNIILLAGVLIPIRSNAQTEFDYKNVEPYVTAAGEFSKDLKTFMVPITKEQWKEVNISRRVSGKAVQTYKIIKEDPFYNRDYFADLLGILRNEFRGIIKTLPTDEELFVYWLIGKEKFQDFAFDVGRVKDSAVLEKLAKFQIINKKVKQEIPAPLPTLGRRPIPHRYWPTPTSQLNEK